MSRSKGDQIYRILLDPSIPTDKRLKNSSNVVRKSCLLSKSLGYTLTTELCRSNIIRYSGTTSAELRRALFHLVVSDLSGIEEYPENESEPLIFHSSETMFRAPEIIA